MDVGDKLKKLRTESKLSIRKLAELTGISASYLSEIESKKKTGIGAKYIHKLGLFFNVSQDYFMSNDELNTAEVSGIEQLKEVIMQNNEDAHVLGVYKKYKDKITPEDLDDILKVVVQARKQRRLHHGGDNQG